MTTIGQTTVDPILGMPEDRRWAEIAGVVAAFVIHAAVALVPVAVRDSEVTPPPMDVTLVDVPEPVEEPPPAAEEEPAQEAVPAEREVAPAPRAPAPAARKESAPVAAAQDAPVSEGGPLVFDGAADWEIATRGGDGTGAGRAGGAGAAGGGGGGGGDARGGGAPARVVAAPRIGRAARVIVEDGCAGFFPTGASHDVADVILRVTVGASGAIDGVVVASETPAGEGFGAAARACLARARAEAARDPEGGALPSAATVSVRFVR